MVDFNRVFELSKWLDNLLRSDGRRFDSLGPKDIPGEGGIYVISDKSKDSEEFLYLGQSSNLSHRSRSMTLMPFALRLRPRRGRTAD